MSRTRDNFYIHSNSKKLYFGTGATEYIYGDGTNLYFYDTTTAAAKTLTQLLAGSVTLDAAFDLGKIIDGASSGATAFKVGYTSASNYNLSLYHDGTDMYMAANIGDLKITAQGGDVNFDNENLITTGKVTADGGLEVGADNVKLTIGAADATDAYMQFNATDLEIYSNAGIRLYTSTDTSDYIIFSTTSDVPEIGTAGNCNLKITASSGTIDFSDDNLTTTGTLTAATNSVIGALTLANGSITDSSGAISFNDENLTTTGTINIAADNVKYTVGASGVTDAYWYFDGAGNLTFYDSAFGNEVTLTNLAGGSLNNPDVTGDLTITNGQFIWTDSTDEVAGTFTISNVANDGIDIVANAATTSNIVHISSTTLTSGSGVRVDTAEATLNGGYYFEAYDTSGTATVFGVKEDGEIEITGAAAADMLTISAGNVQIDNGKIEIDTTQNITTYIKRSQAVTTGPVVEIEETSGDADNPCLLVDHNPTGDINALELTTAGTGYAISATLANTAGEGLEIIFPTGGAANGIFLDGNTNTYVGATGAGMLHIHQSGTLAHANATCQFVNFDGTYANNGAGGCLKIDDNGTADGTNYSVLIESTVNAAKIVSETATTKALLLGGAANHTANLLHVDGVTTDWIGAAATGMVHLASDGALANAGATLLYSTFTGNTAAIIPDGSCAVFYENGTIAAGGYAVKIGATGGGGLNVVQAGTGYTNINVSGPSGQTATMVNIDASTGDNGFVGGDEAACLKISGDAALAHIDSSFLNITNSGTGQVAHMGTSLRIVDTCNAGAGSYAMYLSASDADTEAIKVDAGEVHVDEIVKASGGVITIYSENDISDPPTQAQMDTAFGAGSEAHNGMIGIINDANGGANIYVCVCADGAWYYLAKATIGGA